MRGWFLRCSEISFFTKPSLESRCGHWSMIVDESVYLNIFQGHCYKYDKSLAKAKLPSSTIKLFSRGMSWAAVRVSVQGSNPSGLQEAEGTWSFQDAEVVYRISQLETDIMYTYPYSSNPFIYAIIDQSKCRNHVDGFRLIPRGVLDTNSFGSRGVSLPPLRRTGEIWAAMALIPPLCQLSTVIGCPAPIDYVIWI